METRLDALDGWRAVGALLVVAAHLQGFSAIRLDATPHTVQYGVLGVEYFFGISGFVIARGLMKPSSGAGLASFYVRRFFRILPPLALYIAVISLLALAGVVDSKALGVGRALTFTCNLKNVDCGGWLGDHTWSLSVEEQFYLVIPLLMAWLKPRWLVGLLVLGFAPATVMLDAVKLEDVANLVSSFTVIGMGVFCAIHEPTVRRLAQKTPSWLAAVAFVATVVVIYLPGSRLVSVISAAVFAPLILFVLMVSAFSGGWLTKLMSWKPLTALGGVSYSIYLWQELATRDWAGASPLFYVISVAACIGFAFASYRWFEGPLIAVGRSLSRRIDQRLRPRLVSAAAEG